MLIVVRGRKTTNRELRLKNEVSSLGRVVRGGDTPAKMFSYQLHGDIFYIQLNYTFYVCRLMIFDKI